LDVEAVDIAISRRTLWRFFFAIPGLPRQTLLKIFCSAGEENYLVNQNLLQSIAKMRCNKIVQHFFSVNFIIDLEKLRRIQEQRIAYYEIRSRLFTIFTLIERHIYLLAYVFSEQQSLGISSFLLRRTMKIKEQSQGSSVVILQNFYKILQSVALHAENMNKPDLPCP
jgi:hypothetical protein